MKRRSSRFSNLTTDHEANGNIDANGLEACREVVPPVSILPGKLLGKVTTEERQPQPQRMKLKSGTSAAQCVKFSGTKNELCVHQT